MEILNNSPDRPGCESDSPEIEDMTGIVSDWSEIEETGALDSKTEFILANDSRNYESDLLNPVSESFLEYFLNYPIISHLKQADLLDDSEIIQAAHTWRQMGGKLERVLVDRMGIKSSTINFFNNKNAGVSAKQKGCRRIGEFLRAAGLVSEEEIRFVLQDLERQGRRLKIGEALVEQGLVKQSTIEYFANQFIDEDATTDGIERKPDQPQKLREALDVDKQFQQEEFLLVVRSKDQFSSHTLRTRMYSIGRDTGNDIVVNDSFVSRRHAYLIRTQNDDNDQTTYEVLDCGKRGTYSRNGIFVNGRKVKHQALKYGDVIHIGPKIQARFLPVE